MPAYALYGETEPREVTRGCIFSSPVPEEARGYGWRAWCPRCGQLFWTDDEWMRSTCRA
jgi:uncharacterized protein with PIN domain